MSYNFETQLANFLKICQDNSDKTWGINNRRMVLRRKNGPKYVKIMETFEFNGQPELSIRGKDIVWALLDFEGNLLKPTTKNKVGSIMQDDFGTQYVDHNGTRFSPIIKKINGKYFVTNTGGFDSKLHFSLDDAKDTGKTYIDVFDKDGNLLECLEYNTHIGQYFPVE